MQQKRLIKLVLHIPIILLYQFDKTLLHQLNMPPMRHHALLLTHTLRWAPLWRSSLSNANVLKTLMYKHKG